MLFEFTLDPAISIAVMTGGPILIALATKAGVSSGARRIIAALLIGCVLLASYMAAKWPEHWAAFIAEGTALWLGTKAAYELVDSMLEQATGRGLNNLLLPTLGIGPAEPTPLPPSADIADRLTAKLPSDTPL